MKNFKTILFFLLIGPCLMAFKPEVLGLSEFKVVLDESSSIRIVGETNINCFTCSHNKKLPVDTLFISSYSRGSYFELSDSEIAIPVNGFECGIRQMTAEMMDLLDEQNHPLLKLNVLSLKRIGENIEAFTLINIGGNGIVYKVRAELNNQSDWMSCQGTLSLNIRDFGLEPPTKLLGAVRVKEVITIEFDMKLKVIKA